MILVTIFDNRNPAFFGLRYVNEHFVFHGNSLFSVNGAIFTAVRVR